MKTTKNLILLAIAVAFFAALNVQAYFDPSVGRFASRDPIEEGGGKNLYGFVANNPIQSVDAFGLRPIPFYFDAFINGDQLGLWHNDPGDPSGQFRADDRDFGQFDLAKGNARIYSFGLIESTKIGHAEKDGASGGSDTGASIERFLHSPSILGYLSGQTPYWEYQTRKPQLVGGNPIIKDLTPCKTSITFQASAIHPYGPFGVDALQFIVPSIDYNVTYTFEVTGAHEVTVTLTGTHNLFPDYEGYADGSELYRYHSSWSGPGFIDLSAWTHVPSGKSIVIKGIDVSTCCPNGTKSP